MFVLSKSEARIVSGGKHHCYCYDKSGAAMPTKKFKHQSSCINWCCNQHGGFSWAYHHHNGNCPEHEEKAQNESESSTDGGDSEKNVQSIGGWHIEGSYIF
jgi:hypothetical protein